MAQKLMGRLGMEVPRYYARTHAPRRVGAEGEPPKRTGGCDKPWEEEERVRVWRGGVVKRGCEVGGGVVMACHGKRRGGEGMERMVEWRV